MDAGARFGRLLVRRNTAAGLACLLWLLAGGSASAEPAAGAGMIPQPGALNEDRILGVIPNYQTISDPNAHPAPLTVKQKWTLVARETFDPFNIASAGLASGFSQIGNQTPKYGEGGGAFGMRFGAAFADFATQNLFSAGVLATVLHQDPRYYRKGPGSGVMSRIAYSVSRIVVTRNDSGAQAFNASGVFGMMLGIAASNAYYPSDSVKWPVMAGRLQTSLTGGVIGNLMSEFWPDIQKKVLGRLHGGNRRARGEDR